MSASSGKPEATAKAAEGAHTQKTTDRRREGDRNDGAGTKKPKRDGNPGGGAKRQGAGGKKGQGSAVRALPAVVPQTSPYGRRSLSESLRERRAQQRRRKAISLALAVGLPTVLGAIYFGAIASDRYESVSAFTVHSADGGIPSGLDQFIGALPGASGSSDVLVVRDYILSRDMLAYLLAEHRWREHFSQPSADFLMRLPSDADSEDTFEDYLSRVELTHDTDSGALTMRVQAFGPEAAERFARAILDRSEAAVNRLSEKARGDAVAFAKQEVEVARERVEKARTQLLRMQGEDSEFNPLQSAAAVQGIRASLESELATKRAELNALAGIMSSTAPRVVEVRQQVRSLQREVERQNRRLVNPDSGDSVNDAIAKYEPALFEKEFAERALQSALTSLELARLDASRQHRYLVTIAQPSRPDAPTHPVRWLGVLTTLLLSLVATSIGALVLATVREHSRT